MNNNYYDEQKAIIEKMISEDKLEEASKIIEEELSMPYIPSEFEGYLVDKLNELPIFNDEAKYALSLERIIDLLLKIDKTDKSAIDLIKYLSKFSLAEEKDELEYFYNKSTNLRNRSMLFELLIKMKVDIETPMGNPIKSTSILDLDIYKDEIEVLDKKLGDFELFREIIIELLDDIYLTYHIGNELEGNYIDTVIYIVGELTGENGLKELIDDIKDVENKIKTITTFENF